MENVIKIAEREVILLHEELVNIDMDSLTKTDPTNILGEIVVSPMEANKVGILKAEAEALVSELKLDLKLRENEVRSSFRAQAAKNGNTITIEFEEEEISMKLTEKFLETCHESDKEWLSIRRQMIEAEKNLGIISSLYWSVQEKNRKLNGLTSSITPEDMSSELIEKSVNKLLKSRVVKRPTGSLK